MMSPETIITKVRNVREANALPKGSTVGDRHGGLTFQDSVAAALEQRSTDGWQETRTPSGERWTTITLDKEQLS